MSKVFANGSGDLCSILGRIIPKTQEMVLDTALINTQHYKVRIKSNMEPSPTPWCSSYWKRSLQVPHDYDYQLGLLTMY